MRRALLLAMVWILSCRQTGGAPVARRHTETVLPAGVMTNGVVVNGLYGDLAAGPLSGEQLGSLESVVSGLDDPAFARLIEYLVQCALPEDARIQVGGLEFNGSTGLAPEWADGPCELACQEWVSACLLARNNAYGLPVVLSVMSTNPAMVNDADLRDVYSVQEGAFWGNYFVEPQRQYACRGEGREPLMLTARACARPGNRCGIQYVGPCGATNGETGRASARRACETYDPAHGTYGGCRNRAFDPDDPVLPEGVQATDRVFTTWLRPGPMSAGFEAPCEDDSVPEPEPAEVPGRAGAPCDNDDDCDGTLGLVCETRFFAGYCSNTCEASGDVSAEARACGGEDATCLDWARGQPPVCTAACTPLQRGGDCPSGQICTNGWVNAAQIDEPGCFPFCSSDDDCPPETPCDRNGFCGALPPPDALPDGDPCRFLDETGTSVEEPCRGACYRTNAADQTLGICGSQINLARGNDCPDDPRGMVLITGGDDKAICVFRRCDVDADCTPPHLCLDTQRGRVCDYPG